MKDLGWDELAGGAAVARTMDSLRARNIAVELLKDRGEALRRVTELVPEGAEIMMGSSTTLSEIGFLDLVKSGGRGWRNLKDTMTGVTDPVRRYELRARSSLAQYFLGSVHAVAETGEMVVASMTGSQLPSYAYSSPNVVWVVGTQKIVPDLDTAIKRVWEHCLPLEDRSMKAAGQPGSAVGKLLIFERETSPLRKIRMLLVGEKLGY
ncbi:MAG: lactate utilization protein [Candidatus Bathyarchaeota archaeon]|nr:lactate utilization protein [Candidatus Bathyarchaeota archaeon]